MGGVNLNLIDAADTTLTAWMRVMALIKHLYGRYKYNGLNGITMALNKDLFPCYRYSMRNMARVMRALLHARFPSAQDKDVLKVCSAIAVCLAIQLQTYFSTSFLNLFSTTGL